jgi:hypothetical protein
MKKIYANFILLSIGFLFFCGCASLKETGKKVWGSSIEHLEKERSHGRVQNFALSLDRCFLEVEKLMTATGAQVYLKDEQKRFLAAMNFKGHVDTTQAGIFFTRLEDSKTKVEVSSMSPKLVDDVSEIIFTGLKEFKTD